MEKIKIEKNSAIKKYKHSRKKNFRDLCKKTGSGQILMGRQVDRLLEKIEKSSK